MTLTNTNDTYGTVAKFLHWLIALCVIGMMLMGSFMNDIADKALKFQVYGIHKALGITILALMIVRLGWKLYNWGRPSHNATHKPWEQKLAGLVHWVFYALLLVMPLSGWLLTSAAGSTLSWFGLFPIPTIVEASKEMRHFYGEIHEITANLIWAALALHVGGALKHMVIDRDGTIRRMLPLLAFALLIPFGAAAEDTENTETLWTIQRDQSRLTIEAQQEGSPFKGEFMAFDGTIRLTPEHPEKGTAHIMIDLASFDSGNDERDKTVKEADWFDTDTTPTATYVIDSFGKGDKDGDYIADGRLILRGLERPVRLPFTMIVTTENNIKIAHVKGETSINRLDFGVGGGDWADPSMVGNAVTIRIDMLMQANAS